MEQTKLVPKRRFKVFQNTQAWEQHTISELADRYDNLRVPITASDRMPGNTPYYGANGIQDYVEGFTHCGEFILVAEDGANDLQNYPVQYVNGKVWVNNHAHVLQARSEIADNKFLMNALKQTNIEPYLVGGGRAKLNADVMMKISLRVPELAEQKKIGSFFERLDHLITLHQRKLEKTKALKSAYLSEMFPAEGERVPKRRFAGFTQPWEQRKFSEIATVRRGLTYKPSDITENGIRVLRSSNINEDTFELRSDDVFVKKDAVNIEPVKENDILITSANGSSRLVGKHALINGIKTNMVHGGFMLLASSMQPYFVNALMSSSWYNKFINVYVSGGNGAIGNLSKGDLESQIIYTPSEDEQIKIGNFFKRLDEIITLHQRKLEKLQNLKKAYLNEMFV
nr:restriction endonuclease subunit S [Heyndrickxia coagulans]